ncbi:hypothetical protein EDB83DRAFT_2439632 [Lactarius deliciosus]|nr:hypothetical protein EDB83DRAFT_2439632 [Lactarius deliciosus]
MSTTTMLISIFETLLESSCLSCPSGTSEEPTRRDCSFIPTPMQGSLVAKNTRRLVCSPDPQISAVRCSTSGTLGKIV